MENIEERLAEIYGNRKWILANTVAAGMSRAVEMFEGWGSRVMIVAASPGVGELPEAPIVYTGTRGTSILDSIRRLLRFLGDPSDEVMSAVDGFDPDGDAGVILPLFAEDPNVLRRRAYGVRPAAWTALEDKLEVLSVWDEAGIDTVPYRVVTVSDAAAAAEELRADMGTVWVADNRDGWHGGAEYLRWVRDASQYEEVVAWFGDRADRVRVMPFLEGLPCSIHGWVDERHVASFRPVEILVFLTTEPGFKYAGVSTRWDPPDELRAEMREVARSVGRVLRERVDYRGPFGVDGVATSEGFVPTELNPRLSGGFGLQASKLDIPLGSVLRAVIEDDIEVEAVAIEEEVVESADSERFIRSWVEIPVDYEDAKTSIRFDERWRASTVEDDDSRHGTIELGPTPSGSILMVELDPDEVGVGDAAAPLIAEAANLAAGLWGLDLPPLSPAIDVTTGLYGVPR